jgi:hypothetical protein
MRRADRISIFLALRRACHSQPVVAVFVPGVKGLTSAGDSGDESPCNAVGTLEITCDSVDCTPLVVEYRRLGLRRPLGRPSRPGWRFPVER